jgi:hypothetical protein
MHAKEDIPCITTRRRLQSRIACLMAFEHIIDNISIHLEYLTI